VAGALELEDLLLLRLDAEMPERRLVKGLHAFRGDRDRDAADPKEGHRPEIDVAPARDRAGCAHPAVAEASSH
jgi:hypothetical protein